MGKGNIEATEMWIHETVVFEIINLADEYSGTTNGDKLIEITTQWKKLKEEWDELQKAENYNLNLHARFISLTSLAIEVYNTLDPLKEEDGSFKTSKVPFKDLLLNSKELSGFKMLFHEPPEISALHWYHNALGPFVYKKEKPNQTKIYESIQAIEVNKRIKVKDYLKKEELDKKIFKISLIGKGEIEPKRSNYLEPGNTYLLIDSFGLTENLSYLFHETFGWYTKHFGHIVRGEHSSRYIGGGSNETVAAAIAIKVDTPISIKDYLSNNGLSSRRYGIDHVTMGILDLDTILVPNRSYGLIDKIKIKELNRKMREMQKMFR